MVRHLYDVRRVTAGPVGMYADLQIGTDKISLGEISSSTLRVKPNDFDFDKSAQPQVLAKHSSSYKTYKGNSSSWIFRIVPVKHQTPEE